MRLDKKPNDVAKAAYTAFPNQLREFLNVRDGTLPKIERCGQVLVAKFPKRNMVMVSMQYYAGRHLPPGHSLGCDVTIHLPLLDILFKDDGAEFGPTRVNDELIDEKTDDQFPTWLSDHPSATKGTKTIEYGNPNFFEELAFEVARRYTMVGHAQNEAMRSRRGYALVGAAASVCFALSTYPDYWLKTAAFVLMCCANYIIYRNLWSYWRRSGQLWSLKRKKKT